MYKLRIVVIAVLIVFIACKNKPVRKYANNKLVPNDPFEKTIVESQYFDIDGRQDNIIQGANGTTVVVPEGAFLDKNGKTITGAVKLEIAEALDVSDMLLSNLTTTASGKPLQSGGMVYINAAANGEELFINPKKPLYIEIPTDKKVPGMMAYHGVRDSSGTMDWVDPKPLENYLVPVSLEVLDFLPEGFYNAVEAGMPYRGHLKADRKLADSLYYSLSTYAQGTTPSSPQHQHTNMNEAHYNSSKEIKDGKYTDKSYEVDLLNASPVNKINRIKQTDYAADTNRTAALPDTAKACGINPASVKVIKSEKFENTFIATREFEQRMKHVHSSCQQQVLEIYISNIDKNLWEADKKVFEVLSSAGNKEAARFNDFYNEKLTTVKNSDKITRKLSEYYNRELKKIESELERLKNEEVKQQKKEDKKFEKVKKEYTQVLWKREKNRMEKYGLEWSDMGWLNIDTGVVPKNCLPVKIEAMLTATENFDRVYVYAATSSIKSIFRLNTDDSRQFYAGSRQEHTLEIPCNEINTLVTIAYKGSDAYLAKQQFTSGVETMMEIVQLAKVSTEELKNSLKELNSGFKNENSIATDLKFQAEIYKENQRQAILLQEAEFIYSLYSVAFKCCNEHAALYEGKILFENNCISCHAVCNKVVGPALAGVTRRRDDEWLVGFTRNSAAMIAAGDPIAVKLYEENSKQNMNTFAYLTVEQIRNIYKYVESVECGSIGGTR